MLNMQNEIENVSIFVIPLVLARQSIADHPFHLLACLFVWRPAWTPVCVWQSLADVHNLFAAQLPDCMFVRLIVTKLEILVLINN